jgi:hypothetical protein
MNDEEKAVAELQALLQELVSQQRMQYGIAMQEAGVDDIDIMIVQLKVARAMETWAFENL